MQFRSRLLVVAQLLILVDAGQCPAQKQGSTLDQLPHLTTAQPVTLLSA